MLYLFPRAFAPVCLALLAACSGGGGGGASSPPPSPVVIPALAAPGGSGTIDLSAVSLDSAARSTSNLAGTLDRGDDTFTAGTLSGDITSDRSQVSLTGGGQIVITPGSTEFASIFEATPLNGNRTIGVVGAVTPIVDLPTGTAEYTGVAAVTLGDGVSAFELTGDAVISADFADGTVVTTASGLNGTQTIGAAAPIDVTDVATVTFTDSAISGAGFSGGTPSITSSTITDLGADPNSSLNGAFFGTSADEAGATFVIDDANDSGVIVFGTVLAD